MRDISSVLSLASLLGFALNYYNILVGLSRSCFFSIRRRRRRRQFFRLRISNESVCRFQSFPKHSFGNVLLLRPRVAYPNFLTQPNRSR